MPRRYRQLTSFVLTIAVAGSLCATAAPATAQSEIFCPTPDAMLDDAFDAPMTFSAATNKGNMSTSAWIAASGRIGPETPARFRAFLISDAASGSQIVLNSPGGNLAGGLELGRMIRAARLTAHIGATRRVFESYDAPCDTWWDEVNAGICASSCAYAFLGGTERFVDSPYYPTSENLLGFHQFYGGPVRGSAMLTPEEVADIESSALSVAQAITGQIVLYAMDMGVDPRVVAFASATPSAELYYPSTAELEELSIVSGQGLGPWGMEPYAEGLVTAARPRRSDGHLEQITAFCRRGSGPASLLFTMDLVTPSYPDPDDLPLTGIDMTIDEQTHSIPRASLSVRYAGGSILITMPVGAYASRITAARHLEFRLDGARVMGGFREGSTLDELSRSSIALAWRNCI